MSTASHTTTTPLPTKRTSFKGFHVPYILSWRNPQDTGLLLAEILGFFTVFSSTLSLQLFLRFAFWTVGLLSSAELVTRYLNGRSHGIVSSYQPSRFLPLNDSLANDVATAVSNAIRRALYGVQHVLDARNPVTGLKLAASFWLAKTLLGFLSLKALVLTTILLAFSIPPLYLQFKGPVDAHVNTAFEHIHEHAHKVGKVIYAKAGPQIDFLKKLSGSRGGFPGKAHVDPVKDIPSASAKPTAYTSSSLGSANASTSTPYSSGSTSTAGVAGSVPVHKETHGTSTSSTSTSTTAPSVHTPYSSGPTSAPGVAGKVPVETSFKPEDIVNKFDSVPTFQGNVPIDHQKLNDYLAKDKAAGEVKKVVP